MHTAMRAGAASAAAGLALTLLAGPAAADISPGHGGNNSGGTYSAWAYYVSVRGGESSISQPEPCTLRDAPDQLAHYEYNVISYDGGTTYRVWYDCVADGEILEDADGQFPDDLALWDNIDFWDVTPGPPEDMIEEAISRLNPIPPEIVTDPGGGLPTMVGITTYLSFAAPVGRQEIPVTDGPITVTVWAEPTGEIEWDTGDGLPACNVDDLPAGVCGHLYSVSSLHGGAVAGGRPAFPITAQINYTGGYTVTANGVTVGGNADIGGIQRTSETVLAVEQGQAINDR
ncbi:MAG TPA: hypothetical protein VFI47_16830 [Acidimicrobiales bacterium]|nr:hypothetical protein [Acidimicrobiales bacterium]